MKVTPRRSAQHGLFEEKAKIQARDESGDRRKRWEDRLTHLGNSPEKKNTRVSVLRGFIGLHFAEDPSTLMEKPLMILGGRTLMALATTDWVQAHAWMLEIKINFNEKETYVEVYKKTG